MSIKLHVKAFFFNAKTDYLPYYKIFTLLLKDDATAKDIVAEIKSENENFTYPEKNLIFKINGLMVEGKTSVANIVKELGTELKIDPANSYRSCNGLVINDDDFMESYALLAPYATDADKKYYKTLYSLHYASETEYFEHRYIGDAILVLAHKMITEGNTHKEKILDAIVSADSGLFDCEYEHNVFEHQHHGEAIAALKDMVRNRKSDNNSLLDIIERRFSKKNGNAPSGRIEKSDKVVLEDLKMKQIAYYEGENKSQSTQKLLEESSMHIVKFDRSHKLSGFDIFQENKRLALRKAGTTLLDAYDSGAEVIVVEDNATYCMMRDHFSSIEKVIGREMKGLELISSEDFAAQLHSAAA